LCILLQSRLSGGTELSDLPPRERAQRYRDLAVEAERHGKTAASSNMREAYFMIATEWRKLADKTDAILVSGPR
jgi:hypothetical protein